MKIYGGGYLNEAQIAALGAADVGRNVQVHEQSVLVGLENMVFGSNVRIDAYCVIVCATDSGLRVGDYVHIGSHCILAGSHGFEMKDFSGLSHGVKVFTGSDDYTGRYMTNPTVPEEYTRVKKGKITVGRHAIVGAGTVILPGANLGDGVAVGALSTVIGALEEWTVCKGNPARKVRARSRELLTLERRLIEGESE